MKEFENINEDIKQESEKDPWTNAMEVWNEIFPSGEQYDPTKDYDLPYLAKDYITKDSKRGVWARLYQGNQPSEFILAANGRDPMALLEIAEQLMQKGLNVIHIKGGNGTFRPGESEILANAKLEELRSKFNC
jgi:hypothetical protein